MVDVVSVDRRSIRAWLHGQMPRIHAAAKLGRLPTAALDITDEFASRLVGVPEAAKAEAMRVLAEEIQAATAELTMQAQRSRVGCGSFVMMALFGVVGFSVSLFLVAPKAIEEYPSSIAIPFVIAFLAPWLWYRLTRR